MTGKDRSVAGSAATSRTAIPPGTRDVLPEEMRELRAIGDVLRAAFEEAGYGEVHTPALEYEEVLLLGDARAAGARYRTFDEHGSMYNTPPVFSIYVSMLVTRWLLHDVGGLETQHAHNGEKAGLLYAAIDESGGFYRGHADVGSRSLMNVTWRLPTEDLERAFINEAAAEGLVELKGHRSVGGIRASIYNAMPVEGVRALAGFMRGFAAERG